MNLKDLTQNVIRERVEELLDERLANPIGDPGRVAIDAKLDAIIEYLDAERQERVRREGDIPGEAPGLVPIGRVRNVLHRDRFTLLNPNDLGNFRSKMRIVASVHNMTDPAHLLRGGRALVLETDPSDSSVFLLNDIAGLSAHDYIFEERARREPATCPNCDRPLDTDTPCADHWGGP